MARVRSPNYPAISLPEAIGRVKVIHDAEQHLAAPKEVIAKHLGYNGLNGAALSTISAIGKYGLIEEASGDKMRVSPLAVTILYPPSPPEREAALKEAATKPLLFVEIAKEWEGMRPSDENLRSYLIRRNFAVDAIDRVIKAYRETMDLVTAGSGAYNPPAGNLLTGVQANMPEPKVKIPVMTHIDSQVLSNERPFAITFMGDAIDIAGRISDEQSADRLIEAVTALKTLLRARIQPVASDSSDAGEIPPMTNMEKVGGVWKPKGQ
jgi:hypothetical protein